MRFLKTLYTRYYKRSSFGLSCYTMFLSTNINKSLQHMKRPIIAVDIDETLAPLLSHLNDFHNIKYSTNHTIDNYKSYIFHETWGCSLDVAQEKVSSFFKTSEFTSKIKPYKNSFEALSRLKLDFELHVVTARSNAWEQLTRSWIDLYFPNIFEEIHFSHSWVWTSSQSYHTSSATASSTSSQSSGNNPTTKTKLSRKVEICQEIKAVLLIDDNYDYVYEAINNGIPAILFGNYAWNSDENTNSSASTTGEIIRITDWTRIPTQIYQLCHTKSIQLISNHLKFAAIQMCSTNNKDINFEKSSRLIALAYSKGARFICLPECNAYMGEQSRDVLLASESLRDQYITALCHLASKYSIWLSIGGFPEKCVLNNENDNDNTKSNQILKVYNTHLLITPAGNIAKPIYRKIHLFDCPMVGLYESKTTEPGNVVSVIDIGFASVGLSVCYDLRFPELYSAMCNPNIISTMENNSNDSSITNKTNNNNNNNNNTNHENIASILNTTENNTLCTDSSIKNPNWNYESNNSADIILIPSAFTVPTGTAHWSTLLRARSIENQVYIIAAAQSGRHNERRESYGHSMIIDPWGTILSECSIYNKEKTKIEQSMLINMDTSITSVESSTTNSYNNNSNNTDKTNESINLVHDIADNDITTDGEICYANFSPTFLKSIRNKIPIQSHKRFKVFIKSNI